MQLLVLTTVKEMEKFLPFPGENCSVSTRDAWVHVLLYKLYANVSWFEKNVQHICTKSKLS